MVRHDLSRLKSVPASCEQFADKRLAHRDARDLKTLPTFNEVDACIELPDQLYAKYLLAFEAKRMDTLLPVWQYDWKAIFRTPWLPTTP